MADNYSEYIFPDQENYGFGLTFKMPSKAPAIAKRIFATYDDASGYTADVKDSAIPGLALSVINDPDASKNGLYFVKSIDPPVLERVGSLEEIASLSGDLATLSANVIDNEQVVAAAFVKVKDAVGLTENLEFDSDLGENVTDALENINAKIDSEIARNYFDSVEYVRDPIEDTALIIFGHNGESAATLDASDFIIDGMVQSAYVENNYLVIEFNTDAGKSDVRVPIEDIFNPSNYYTKIDTDALLAGKQETLVSGTNIKTINNQSLLGDGNIDIQGGGSGVTSAQVQTMIDASISGKEDKLKFYTEVIDSSQVISSSTISVSNATVGVQTLGDKGLAYINGLTTIIGAEDNTYFIGGNVNVRLDSGKTFTYNDSEVATVVDLEAKADASAVTNADWSAASGTPGYIENKPNIVKTDIDTQGYIGTLIQGENSGNNYPSIEVTDDYIYIYASGAAIDMSDNKASYQGYEIATVNDVARKADASAVTNADWDAVSGSPAYIENKPSVNTTTASTVVKFVSGDTKIEIDGNNISLINVDGGISVEDKKVEITTTYEDLGGGERTSSGELTIKSDSGGTLIMGEVMSSSGSNSISIGTRGISLDVENGTAKYNGKEIATKSDLSNYVDKTTNQTIGGVKTFSGVTYFTDNVNVQSGAVFNDDVDFGWVFHIDSSGETLNCNGDINIYDKSINSDNSTDFSWITISGGNTTLQDVLDGKVNESTLDDYVDKSSDEEISGYKTFKEGIIVMEDLRLSASDDDDFGLIQYSGTKETGLNGNVELGKVISGHSFYSEDHAQGYGRTEVNSVANIANGVISVTNDSLTVHSGGEWDESYVQSVTLRTLNGDENLNKNNSITLNNNGIDIVSENGMSISSSAETDFSWITISGGTSLQDALDEKVDDITEIPPGFIFTHSAHSVDCGTEYYYNSETSKFSTEVAGIALRDATISESATFSGITSGAVIVLGYGWKSGDQIGPISIPSKDSDEITGNTVMFTIPKPLFKHYVSAGYGPITNGTVAFVMVRKASQGSTGSSLKLREVFDLNDSFYSTFALHFIAEYSIADLNNNPRDIILKYTNNSNVTQNAYLGMLLQFERPQGSSFAPLNSGDGNLITTFTYAGSGTEHTSCKLDTKKTSVNEAIYTIIEVLKTMM